MKLRRDYIDFLSGRILHRLVAGGFITLAVDRKIAHARVSQSIVDDLQVEEKLDEEVRHILEGYTQQMRQQHIEYHEMFQVVKRKLVKERNLIL